MRQNLDKLWAEIYPGGGPGPAANPAEIKRRVNAALDAVPSERNRHMRYKLRFAAVCAVLAAALAGTALAAYRHYTALQYFQGDLTVVAPAVQPLDHTLENGSYRIHVDSVLAGSHSTVIGLTIEALTDEALSRLNSGEFFPTRVVGFQAEYQDQSAISLTYTGGQPEDSGSVRSFSVRLNGVGAPNTLYVYLRGSTPETGFPLALDHPLESLSVRSDVPLEGREWVVRSCTLNAMEISMEVQFAAPYTGGEIVECCFRMADGSLKTLPQLKGTASCFTAQTLMAGSDSAAPTYRLSAVFRTPIDPLSVQSVLINGMEYPFLDPEGAAPAEIPETMRPFLIPFMEREQCFYLSAAGLCGHIGGALEREGDAFTVRCLDKTLTVTPGSASARLNGAELELACPPRLEGDGLLLAREQVELLGLSCSMYYPDSGGPVRAPEYWLITP